MTVNVPKESFYEIFLPQPVEESVKTFPVQSLYMIQKFIIKQIEERGYAEMNAMPSVKTITAGIGSQMWFDIYFQRPDGGKPLVFSIPIWPGYVTTMPRKTGKSIDYYCEDYKHGQRPIIGWTKKFKECAGETSRRPFYETDTEGCFGFDGEEFMGNPSKHPMFRTWEK